MAAIRPCTGTTADWKAVEDTLILKEREIGVELDASGHYQIRQGDGKKKFFDLPIIVNNASIAFVFAYVRSSVSLSATFTIKSPLAIFYASLIVKIPSSTVRTHDFFVTVSTIVLRPFTMP